MKKLKSFLVTLLLFCMLFCLHTPKVSATGNYPALNFGSSNARVYFLRVEKTAPVPRETGTMPHYCVNFSSDKLTPLEKTTFNIFLTSTCPERSKVSPSLQITDKAATPNLPSALKNAKIGFFCITTQVFG